MPKGTRGITTTEKVCPACGGAFSVRAGRDHQKTCSVACGQKMRLAAIGTGKRQPSVELKCVGCGVDFKTFASRALNGAMYCSRTCSDAAMSLRVEKACETCSKPFEVAKFRAEGARFCSIKCARVILGLAMRKRAPVTCACCSKEFETFACKVGRKKFCSKACMWQVMRGEGSPHWAGVGVYEYVTDETGAEVKRKNKPAAAAKTAARNAGILQATPAWADMKKIRAVYRAAAKLTKETGIPHHVDHMVPLNSKLVCGLHVENNLQVLPWIENLKKWNTTWPDMP
jgi:hypothetical protein